MRLVQLAHKRYSRALPTSACHSTATVHWTQSAVDGGRAQMPTQVYVVRIDMKTSALLNLQGCGLLHREVWFLGGGCNDSAHRQATSRS